MAPRPRTRHMVVVALGAAGLALGAGGVWLSLNGKW